MPRYGAAKRIVRNAVTAPVAVFGTLAAALTPTAAEARESERSTLPTVSFDREALRQATASVAPASPAPLSSASSVVTHTVTRGDTVWDLARRHGSSVAAILKANGLGASAIIFPGQRLTIPAATVPKPRLAAAKQTSASSSATSGVTHTVVRGDTVYAIAKRYGSTVSAILKANGIGSSAIIFPGQKLTIPGASSGGPATAGTSTGTTKTPKSGTTHTVVRGDTVYAIAKRYGSTVSAIVTANKLGSNALIRPGQKLTVPAAKAGGTGTGSTASTGTPTVFAPGQKSAKLDAEQIKNVRLIIRVGRELDVPERGIAIALATAMVESWIRNLDYGDRDSLGLFQQRPSTGWGTAKQIRNAERSIRVFYGGPQDPNGSRTRGLLDIPNWSSLGFSQAAQRVQISAYPDRYGQWERAAYEWLELYG